MCELFHTVSANRACSSAILLLGCSLLALNAHRFRGNPAARRLGSGREAAHLDLEQFRTIQVCPKDLPIRLMAG